MNEWVTIVDWLPTEEADRRFGLWLRDSGWNGTDIPQEALKVDTANGEDGEYRRYLIASSVRNPLNDP
jgi:hypothetical protein